MPYKELEIACNT